MAQSDNLLQEEVNVLLLRGRIGQHTAEEVDLQPQRLVANHDRAVLHHPGFDLRSNLHTHTHAHAHTHSVTVDSLVTLAWT